MVRISRAIYYNGVQYMCCSTMSKVLVVNFPPLHDPQFGSEISQPSDSRMSFLFPMDFGQLRVRGRLLWVRRISRGPATCLSLRRWQVPSQSTLRKGGQGG
jgi:hypothetical protein